MTKDILIISLPNCSKCDEIKTYLKENKIPFKDRMLDSELQTELVMENIYFNPPVIRIDNRYFSYKDFIANSEEMFKEDTDADCSEGCSCCQK